MCYLLSEFTKLKELEMIMILILLAQVHIDVSCALDSSLVTKASLCLSSYIDLLGGYK